MEGWKGWIEGWMKGGKESHRGGQRNLWRHEWREEEGGVVGKMNGRMNRGERGRKGWLEMDGEMGAVESKSSWEGEQMLPAPSAWT